MGIYLCVTQWSLAARYALDLTNKNWDARLMFFRCGDLIVEVYQPCLNRFGPERDRFFGLSWRTDNIEATHSELRERGFDVSEIRTGRRPGTRVLHGA